MDRTGKETKKPKKKKKRLKRDIQDQATRSKKIWGQNTGIRQNRIEAKNVSYSREIIFIDE